MKNSRFNNLILKIKIKILKNIMLKKKIGVAYENLMNQQPTI